MAVRVYISQPMRGKTNEEIEETRKLAFEDAKQYLTTIEKIPEENIELVDSFLKDYKVPESDEYHIEKPIYMLGKSIQILSTADWIYMGKEWEDHTGCRIEFTVAKYYGIHIIHNTWNGKEQDVQ